ncbi:MAG: aldose 1-epimerase family protein [Frankiales bacterium]|nr:aldose 1-epimerase family protein [Frankiales bacterium]
MGRPRNNDKPGCFRMIPSGEQVRLTSGDYAAVVTEVGASLRELTFRGSDVTKPFREDQRMQLHRGGVLAPWPNRIGDGKYTFNGVEMQVPVNEVARHTALHGLVNWHPWAIASSREDQATLRTRVWPQPGYEFTLDLSITYALSADAGLTITLTATNAGDSAAPFGSGIHPYLVAGDNGVDEYTMTVPAASVLDVDPERLLPTGGTSPVAGTELDFREPRLVGRTRLDHALLDVIAGADGIAVARVVGPTGRGAEIVWDATICPWVQVHTADRPDVENNRVAMAIEPMTCPPDAFRTGDGLIVLEPGQSTSAWWTIRAIGG